MIEIRQAGPAEDFAAISQIYVKSWQAAYAHFLPKAELAALSGEGWCTALPQMLPWLLLAEEESKIVGVASFGPAREADFAGWGEVVSLYLLPEVWRRGIGSLLLQAVQAALQELGFSQQYLWVAAENRLARSFYEKQGWFWQGDSLQEEVLGKPVQMLRYVFAPKETAAISPNNKNLADNGGALCYTEEDE